VEEKAPASTSSSKTKLLFVLVVVFIICGGNGLGLLMGGLVWHATGQIGLAIAVMVGITLLALGIAICVIVACRHLAEGNQPQVQMEEDSTKEDQSVISEG
jgi:predicted lipid-binding transport protein (Tim44 family)